MPHPTRMHSSGFAANKPECHLAVALRRGRRELPDLLAGRRFAQAHPINGPRSRPRSPLCEKHLLPRHPSSLALTAQEQQSAPLCGAADEAVSRDIPPASALRGRSGRHRRCRSRCRGTQACRRDDNVVTEFTAALARPDAVNTDAATLTAEGHDFWGFGGTPGLVLRPCTREEVLAVVRIAAEHHTPLVTRGGASSSGAIMPNPQRGLVASGRSPRPSSKSSSTHREINAARTSRGRSGDATDYRDRRHHESARPG